MSRCVFVKASTQKGLSLLEMMLCLSILLITISYATPQLMRLVAYFDSRSTQQSLLTYIASARAEALYKQRIVTLCPLADDQKCSSDWNRPLVYFFDDNTNAELDPSEEPITLWASRKEIVNMSWTLNRRYIRFRPNGSTTATTGSLRYCNPIYQGEYSFRLVIARTGRTRVDPRDHGCQV